MIAQVTINLSLSMEQVVYHFNKSVRHPYHKRPPWAAPLLQYMSKIDIIIRTNISSSILTKPKIVIYFVKDPLGWGVQFDYPYFNSPGNLPFYTTTCKSNDGCSGQGFCDLKWRGFCDLKCKGFCDLKWRGFCDLKLGTFVIWNYQDFVNWKDNIL